MCALDYLRNFPEKQLLPVAITVRGQTEPVQDFRAAGELSAMIENHLVPFGCIRTLDEPAPSGGYSGMQIVILH